ncbi:MAG: phosphoenolpyruvate--protein phosphotransferase [Gammaproteobacteria bacterium]|nr:phosphoenolpyruvate--protein phosphotransferase [Gammaproteobacteria bacterium]
MTNRLQRIIEKITGAQDLAALVTLLSEEILSITDADSCSIFFTDDNNGEYFLVDKELRAKYGFGVLWSVASRMELINLPEITREILTDKANNFLDKNTRSLVCVPIINRRELVGILMVESEKVHGFSDDTEAFLLTLISQISAIIVEVRGSVSSGRQQKSVLKDGMILQGIPAVSGVAIGKIAVIYPPAQLDNVPDKKVDNPKTQIEQFNSALKDAYKEISTLIDNIKESLAKDQVLLFEAYLQMLEGDTLKTEVYQEIRNGNWAEGALRLAVQTLAGRFEAMEDSYLRERAGDVCDLGQRILSHLQSRNRGGVSYHKKTILVGEDIAPADIIAVPKDRMVGIISFKGSNNSHTAILARSLGIPTVMGLGGEVGIGSLDGKEAIIDGYQGEVYLSPKKALKQEFLLLTKQEKELTKELESIRKLPAVTKDGQTVKLLVNTGLPIDINNALKIDSDGVGLYRTEMPFMLRERFPTEEEQFVLYRQLLKIFAPRPVVMRTLDIGGDKSLPYFTIQETNPFLGWRGVRISLDHPEIFLVQIRAMLRANIGFNNLRIMLPMISALNEVEVALQLIRQARDELAEKYPDIVMPQIGVMIEVPAAVYQAQDLAKRVDFVSVGSNDLTQYLLAVDRNNTQVAGLYNSLHPAVLRALMQTVHAAHKEKVEVSICGEMASDPVAIMLLLAMGFDALSMNANQILRAKWLIRNINISHAKELLEEVTQMDDALEIRYRMESVLEEVGLAGLIRAGR